MVKINDLKVGQRVRTTVEGIVTMIPNGSTCYVAIEAAGPGPNPGRVTVSYSAGADFEVLPNPLKPGDPVKPNPATNPNQTSLAGEIIAIDGDTAWVRWSNTKNLWQLSSLVYRNECNC